MKRISPYLISLVGLVGACGGDGGIDMNEDSGIERTDANVTRDADVPDNGNPYIFDSRFEPGVSPVSKEGPAFRQILIVELKSHMDGLTASVDALPPNPGATEAGLEFYLDFNSTTSGMVALTIATTPESLQSVFNHVSSGQNLVAKVAGNDTVTDHKDWSAEFIGWPGGDGSSPEALLRNWAQEVDELAVARLGDPELAPDGSVISDVFITAKGQDLQQLIQKLLLVSIGMSQGMDDFLDDDVKGKGLLSSNTRDGQTSYSELGNAWDQAFGYFGASLDYDLYTDEERAFEGGRVDYQGYHDLDSDRKIDLVSEYNFGFSVTCGERDRGADITAKTTYGDDAFAAFRDGRAFILAINGELSPAQLDALRVFRDEILDNWEKCVAATVVHHVNEVRLDMQNFGSNAYDFESHAKHWSELKGFALGFQFNPSSPMNSQDSFSELHTILGTAPVLESAPMQVIVDYLTGLDRVKTLMKEAYGFDDINLIAW